MLKALKRLLKVVDTPARLRPYVVFTFTLIRRTGDHTQKVYRIHPAVLEENIGLWVEDFRDPVTFAALGIGLAEFFLDLPAKGDIGRTTQNWRIPIGIGTGNGGEIAA